MSEKHEYYLEEYRKLPADERTYLHKAAFKLLIDGEFTSSEKERIKYIMNDRYDIPKYSDYLLDFENKLATISFDKNKQTPESLSKIVEAVAGGDTYTVSSIK